MIFLHKLHSHVHYEEVYLYKRFQKFSIKTLTRIAYQNLKNKQNLCLPSLGDKPLPSSRTYSKGFAFVATLYESTENEKVTDNFGLLLRTIYLTECGILYIERKLLIPSRKVEILSKNK